MYSIKLIDFEKPEILFFWLEVVNYEVCKLHVIFNAWIMSLQVIRAQLPSSSSPYLILTVSKTREIENSCSAYIYLILCSRTRGGAAGPSVHRSLDSPATQESRLKYVQLLDPHTRANRWMHTTWHHLPGKVMIN